MTLQPTITKKLANIAFKRETEEMFYDNTEYDPDIDAAQYCEQALTLFERFKSCYNSDHVDSVVQLLLEIPGYEKNVP